MTYLSHLAGLPRVSDEITREQASCSHLLTRSGTHNPHPHATTTSHLNPGNRPLVLEFTLPPPPCPPQEAAYIFKTFYNQTTHKGNFQHTQNNNTWTPIYSSISSRNFQQAPVPDSLIPATHVHYLFFLFWSILNEISDIKLFYLSTFPRHLF